MDIYLELKNYLPHDHGHYRSGLCPFHDDHTPSLLAYQDGFFICEACGEQGNSLRLLTKFKGGRIGHSRKYGQPDVHLPTWDQQDELGELMAEAHRVLLNFPGMRWYLRQRGVESRWQPCRLGWHEGWMTLPVTTQSGKIGLMLRATPGIHSQQRFTSPAGQPALLYCPDLEKLAQAKQAFIVFGMFDALTFAELGLPVVTTTGGKDSFDPAWLNNYRIPFWIIRDDKEEAIQAKLLAGLTGVGGGIFLSPLLLFAGWATLRVTAATSVAFILVNSAAGLLGQWHALATIPSFAPGWAIAAVIGGTIGSGLGARYLPGPALRAVLALVLLAAGMKLILG